MRNYLKCRGKRMTRRTRNGTIRARPVAMRLAGPNEQPAVQTLAPGDGLDGPGYARLAPNYNGAFREDGPNGQGGRCRGNVRSSRYFHRLDNLTAAVEHGMDGLPTTTGGWVLVELVQRPRADQRWRRSMGKLSC